MEFKRSKVSKRVFCCKCKDIGYICGLYLAPRGWKRVYSGRKYGYSYYCRDCADKYLKTMPLF